MKKAPIITALIIILGAGYYAISPLFITITVHDSLSESATVSSYASPIIDTRGHPASGVVRLINQDGDTIIRYEDYETINGPDLYVYLAKDIDAKEFVSLGEIRGTEGNINYPVPNDVNVSEYKYVLTWCKQFGVLFNYAELVI